MQASEYRVQTGDLDRFVGLDVAVRPDLDVRGEALSAVASRPFTGFFVRSVPATPGCDRPLCEDSAVIERSEIRYAVVDGHHIAFRVLTGDPGGAHELVMVIGGNFPMDSLPADPLANRLLEGLAGLGRLVVFDRRGIGLSDQITDWDRSLRAQWQDDLAGVIDAAGFSKPTIFSWAGQAVARG